MADLIVIETVSPGATRLAAVKALWRENSATLGFFPDGAFNEHARRGWLLAATNEAGRLAGYLIYRLSGTAVVIVHLCVATQFRRRSVARLLLAALRTATADCSGIRANCRADFPADTMWPRLNFVVRAEKPAREEGRLLRTWWYDYGHPDLFQSEAPEVPIAALDANVFFDLLEPDSQTSRESRGLLVGWLQDLVRIAIAPETYNEIARRTEAGGRTRARRRADAFPLLRPTSSVDSWVARVRELLGAPVSVSDESDHRQLAGSVAGGARFFVTRDGELLAKGDRIFHETGITVLRPSELISLTDEELNSAPYQPARLAGVHIALARVRASDIDSLAIRFLAHEDGEKKAHLLAEMRAAASAPDRTDFQRIDGADGIPVALLLLDFSDEHRLRVRLFRVKGTPTDRTLAQHLVWHSVREGVRLGKNELEVTDLHLSSQIQAALQHLYFTSSKNGFVRRSARGLRTLEEMERCLGREISLSQLEEGTSGIAESTATVRARQQLLLESALWPAKASNGPLDTYIVPIRPHWAMQLFDEQLSREDLFGGDPSLLLRTENIYYRAARPSIPKAPSRVLWYVSTAKGVSRAGQLVACSLVTGQFVDQAKVLFKRFQRLGAFGWHDVLRVARGVPTNRVLGFTFGYTELFSRPVPWRVLRVLLGEHGLAGTTLQAPVRVPPAFFAAVYKTQLS